MAPRDLPAATAAGTASRRLAALRDEPRFRLLFASQVLSILGDRVTFVVLPFAVLAVGGDVGDVGLVSAAQFLPFALVSLPAGVLADRFDRRRILVISDVVRLCCQLTSGVLLVTGTATVMSLAALAFLFGLADGFFAPAFTGLIPSTVAAARLQQANALLGLAISTSTVLGPVLAGLLVALAGGPGVALLFDAATFAASALLLLRLRVRVMDPATGSEAGFAPTGESAPGFRTSLRDGWVEVSRRRWLWRFLIGLSVYHVVVLPAVFVLGPVVAEQDLGGARSWALITAGFGAGCILGDLLFLHWRPRHALRVAALLLVGASCQAAVFGSGLDALPMAALETAAGVCVTGCFTLWETSLQEHVPQRALSRVASYDYLTSTGTLPLGSLLAGLSSAWIGLQPTLVAMTAIGLASACLVAAAPSVRQLPRGEGGSGDGVPGAAPATGQVPPTTGSPTSAATSSAQPHDSVTPAPPWP